ncbi:hypothetical protein NOR_08366 [Metarhizium rileyi]|uniref:Uncharacterized protein n=1 Tax=Metarhizium rileyi (strain RCEF 4871) TaxID=1649241 RepID=A0A166WDE5_METRR|nr:hypothetical protein NOR_08366 [Metarhizium rileyi RCEF 4871]
MPPRLPYTPARNRPSIVLVLVLLVLVFVSRSLAAQSIERMRHGPALPARPTGLESADSRHHGSHTANDADHDEPRGPDAQRPSHSHALHVGRRDASIPAYTPIVTPAPDQEAVLASQGYKQETLYTCNTIGGNEHCGWHIPIVKAQGARRDSAIVWLVVGCLAGVFALGLM